MAYFDNLNSLIKGKKNKGGGLPGTVSNLVAGKRPGKSPQASNLFIPPGVFDKETEKSLRNPGNNTSGGQGGLLGNITTLVEGVVRGRQLLPYQSEMKKAIKNRDIFAYQSAENRLRDAIDFDRELPLEAPDPEQIKQNKRRSQSRRGGRRSTLLTSGMGTGGSGYGLGG